jgi:hypothetical protein
MLIGGLFPLPLLGMLSAAVVVMTAQHKGPREALTDCLLAFLVLGIMGWFAGMNLPTLLGSAVISWAVWLLLGSLIGATSSLALGIQAAVLVALLALVGFSLMLDDPAAYWSQVLEVAYAEWAEQGLLQPEDMLQLAGMMSGLLVAGSLTSGVIVLLLGTALASHLRDNDWAAQFRALQLGYVIGGLAALAGVLSLFGLSLDGALLVFGVAFVFHGIAVVAWWGQQRAWPRGWWIGLFILPILLPQFLLIEAALLSALGFVDNWFDLRRKPQGTT